MNYQPYPHTLNGTNNEYEGAVKYIQGREGLSRQIDNPVTYLVVIGCDKDALFEIDCLVNSKLILVSVSNLWGGGMSYLLCIRVIRNPYTPVNNFSPIDHGRMDRYPGHIFVSYLILCANIIIILGMMGLLQFPVPIQD